VLTAEIIGHAVVGFDPADPQLGPATLVRGQLFAAAQIRGVVEEDFFDWILEANGGPAFVSTLARRLAQFAWGKVEHDVMKVLYESVIAADTRKSLGEYYTPDWLAEAIVNDAVPDPLTQRVLDPSCGSGTFVFHAVRRYLTTATAAGHTPAQAIDGVTQHVLGVDVHPVAVTLARVTYLLAIGRGRLAAADRPAFTVPVYLGDSVQWGQNPDLLDSDALVVPTGDGATLFADELRFPHRVVEDAARFDALIGDLADAAALPDRPAPAGVLNGAFRRHAVHPDDQPMVAASYRVLCELHDSGRNHIWGYYLRNLARPLWLARPGNRVDVLVGNPPRLSYRYMPPGMKAEFRAMSTDRGFWAGAAVATHQDLSALFVARAVEQYLQPGGTFAFVMPLAVLSRRQFAGFRTGRWTGGVRAVGTSVAFQTSWDLHQVKPSFFPVPAAVVRGVACRERCRAARRRRDLVWAGQRPQPQPGRRREPPRSRPIHRPACRLCSRLPVRAAVQSGCDAGAPVPGPGRPAAGRAARGRCRSGCGPQPAQHQRKGAVEDAAGSGWHHRAAVPAPGVRRRHRPAVPRPSGRHRRHPLGRHPAGDDHDEPARSVPRAGRLVAQGRKGLGPAPQQ